LASAFSSGETDFNGTLILAHNSCREARNLPILGQHWKGIIIQEIGTTNKGFSVPKDGNVNMVIIIALIRNRNQKKKTKNSPEKTSKDN
jgi:hypothetical protein